MQQRQPFSAPNREPYRKNGRLVSCRFSCVVWCVVLGLLFALPHSVHSQEVSNGYGKRKGKGYSKSVNGTGALIELFTLKGHNVTTWKKISPRIEKYQTLVWTPDGMEVPNADVTERLNRWLASGNNRTLIYVGRDFDAEAYYWRKVLANAPAEDKPAIERQLASARSRWASQRAAVNTKQDCDWFSTDATKAARNPTTLQGAWSTGVDPTKVDILVDLRITPNSAYNSTPLLASDGDFIASEITSWEWGNSSKLIVVNNGSFLVNAGLVNKENRKLASQLVDSCPPGPVMFLESWAWIQVQDSQEQGESHRLAQWLGIWPINLIVIQFIIAVILFVFTHFPIFGRPRELVEESTVDFGDHIESLGELVRKTGDKNYALSRIEYYQEHVKRDAGTRNIRL